MVCGSLTNNFPVKFYSMRKIIPFFLAIASMTTQAQTEAKTRYIKTDPRYIKYILVDTSFYGEIQRTWIAQQGISYGSFVTNLITPLGTRRVEMRPGEGQKKVTLLAANLDLRYPINMGRPDKGSWKRRNRLTFDYRGNFHMTLDDSSPILPMSNEVGIGNDFTFYDSKHGMFYKDKVKGDQTPLTKDDRFHFLTLTSQAHHYSNGQPAGSKYTDSLGNTRNDYERGNFSTNLLRFKLINSWVNNSRHQLINASAGIRLDGQVTVNGKGLEFEDSQRKAYGKTRAEFMFDWYTGILGDTAKTILRLWEGHIRFEGDLILSKDLSNFVPNLMNDTKKYRAGGHLFFEARPLSHRSVGYMLHLYAGRDYLNVRYDDIVFMAMLGFTFSADKYYPVGWRTKNLHGFKK